MGNLSEFGFKDVIAGAVTMDALPAQPGAGFEPLRQPGDFVYQLPSDPDVLAASFEKDIDEKGTAWPALNFKDDARLHYSDDGTRFRIRLSSAPRNGKPGSLVYLAQALGYTGPVTPGKIAGAIVAHAGGVFKAKLNWATYCNANADIYGEDGQRVAGKKGCGLRYAENAYKRSDGVQVLAIPQNAEGKLVERFICANPQCGAHLRVFGDLRNFRKV